MAEDTLEFVNRVNAEVKDLKQQGRAEEATVKAREALARDPGNNRLQFSLGWCLFELLKKGDDMGAAISQLREYGTLKGIHQSGLLHSKILEVSRKWAGDWDGYDRFVKWWDLTKLQEEDRKPYRGEKRTYPSLWEKVASALCLHAVNRNKTGVEAEWIVELAREVVGDSVDQWTVYRYAKLLLSRGEREAAREMLVHTVRNNEKKFWAWRTLGDTYSENEHRLPFYCRGYLCKGDDEFYKTGFYLEFVELLGNMGLFEEATLVAKRLNENKDGASEKRQREIERLSREQWIVGSPTVDLERFCRERAIAAEEQILDGVPASYGLVDHINEAKKLAWVLVEHDKGLPLHFKQSREVRNLKQGEVLKVWIEKTKDGKEKIRKWEQTEKRNIEGLYSEFSGVVDSVHERGFCFARTDNHSIFISPPLTRDGGIEGGARVRGWAVWKLDKKKNEMGWSATSVEKAD